MKIRWRYGIVAGVALMIFGLYPQLKLWYVRGASWQGTYAYNDIDEVAYASYLNALIEGRPRKNDPYTRRDDSVETPQEESLFSIQFAAPMLISVFARATGISAPAAMWISGGLAAFFTALILFWLIARFTEDSIFAMSATLIVLCGGALAAGEGAIGEILENGIAYPYFPFLRRYVPATPFPFFMAFCLSLWLILSSENKSRKIALSVIAIACFAFTVFSYFYIWTTAAVLIYMLVVFVFLFRPETWRDNLRYLVFVAMGCGVVLIPYAYLLSKRSHTMDDVQLLVQTRAPDLWRFPELICYAVLISIGVGVIFRVINFRDPRTFFALALAVTPIMTFNQQILTGKSLQPIHYQVFIGNYVAAMALVFAIGLFWRKFSHENPKVFSAIAIMFGLLATAWGFVECHYTVRVLDEANKIRDEALIVAHRINELESVEPTNAAVFSVGLIEADDFPAFVSLPVLWSRHQHIFAGLSWNENKERYYRYLYYSDLDADWLESSMKNGDFVSTIALFGWGRHSSRLSADARSLTYGEIESEASIFRNYCEYYDFDKASQPEIAYLITRLSDENSFRNFDRWYVRDEGEKLGKYVLYRTRLRTAK